MEKDIIIEKSGNVLNCLWNHYKSLEGEEINEGIRRDLIISCKSIINNLSRLEVDRNTALNFVNEDQRTELILILDSEEGN